MLLNSMDIHPAGVAGMSLAVAGAARPTGPTGLSAADAALAGDAEEEVGTGETPPDPTAADPWVMAWASLSP